MQPPIAQAVANFLAHFFEISIFSVSFWATIFPAVRLSKSLEGWRYGWLQRSGAD
jgi:hypothetical protein